MSPLFSMDFLRPINISIYEWQHSAVRTDVQNYAKYLIFYFKISVYSYSTNSLNSKVFYFYDLKAGSHFPKIVKILLHLSSQLLISSSCHWKYVELRECGRIGDRSTGCWVCYNSGQSFLGLGSANISSIRSRAQQTKTKRDTLQKQSGWILTRYSGSDHCSLET